MAPTLSLTGDLRGVNRNAEKLLNELGDAKGELLKSGSVTLARSWRKVLRVSGNPRGIRLTKRRQAFGGTPSRPGEPPRKQSGRLAKSVAQGPSGTGRKVAVLAFTGPLLEGGVTSAKGKRRLVIAPRPSAVRAYDAVKDQMGGIAASVALQETVEVLG